jgi:hypothetical protein
MATSGGTYSGSAEQRATRSVAEYEHELSGWVMFAGMMLAIVGIVNVVYGIAAISNANFYAADTHFVISNLNTWGWVMLILGVVQVAAACSLFLDGAWASRPRGSTRSPR